ncbi:MAG: hydroxymethylbilane synthase [Candidatus Velthaea sp.]
MYPIILAVRGRRALVVGGGRVAERKVRGLLDADADVTVVSPRVTPALAQLADVRRIRWIERSFVAGDAAGNLLVLAATDDAGVNADVVADARAHRALAADAGDAARGDFSTPAVHRSGALTVTVDSSGLSPSFTQRIRDELALQFDARYARAAANLGALRERVQAVVPQERRAAVMRHFAERDIDDLAGMPPSEIEHEVERACDTVAQVAPADPRTLVCATRGSALALTQTRSVMAKLATNGIASTVLTVTTSGDRFADRALSTLGTDSIFVKELELALRERRADYAVHSCKDLPSTLPDDMCIAAITAREDARDVFCSETSATFNGLPAGARVGTSSPRRRAQLYALRPDLVYVDIRGNVDTRLRKLREGQFDAIVLASAGLRRLGVRATYTVPFAPADLTPAVGQGALALETRAADALASRLHLLLTDPVADLCVRAERAFLRTLRGGCQAPVGAYATYTRGEFHIVGVIAQPDGSHVVRGERFAMVSDIATAEGIGAELAADLLARGGSAIVGALPRSGNGSAAGPLAGRLFLLPRTQERSSRIAPALREAGAEVVEAADSDAAREALGDRVPTAILFPSSGSVLAITGYLAALRKRGGRPMVAAMGPSSSASAGACGFPPDVVAPVAEAAAFVQTVTRFVLERGT